jgi:hypothetical protein
VLNAFLCSWWKEASTYLFHSTVNCHTLFRTSFQHYTFWAFNVMKCFQRFL